MAASGDGCGNGGCWLIDGNKRLIPSSSSSSTATLSRAWIERRRGLRASDVVQEIAPQSRCAPKLGSEQEYLLIRRRQLQGWLRRRRRPPETRPQRRLPLRFFLFLALRSVNLVGNITVAVSRCGGQLAELDLAGNGLRGAVADVFNLAAACSGLRILDLSGNSVGSLQPGKILSALVGSRWRSSTSPTTKSPARPTYAGFSPVSASSGS